MRLALIIVALAAGVATAAPNQDLEQARQAYRSGQYSQALPLFNALLYPPPPKLAQADELTDAYLALGVCRYETGDFSGAKREFVQALTIDPNSRIDPLIVSDPQAIQTFNETKVELLDRLKAEADAKRRADLVKLRASIIGFQSHPLYLNFVPFGTGQFQNGDNARGAFFAVSEGITLVASVTVWAYLVDKYGINSTHVPLADGPNVRFLQQIEIGSGALFFGLWIYGGIDAYRHYKPQTRATIDDSLLPPELRDLDKKPKATKPAKSSLLDHLTPMVTPSGVGIGLAWEQ